MLLSFITTTTTTTTTHKTNLFDIGNLIGLLQSIKRALCAEIDVDATLGIEHHYTEREKDVD
jgi:hypothetical protein